MPEDGFGGCISDGSMHFDRMIDRIVDGIINRRINWIDR